MQHRRNHGISWEAQARRRRELGGAASKCPRQRRSNVSVSDGVQAGERKERAAYPTADGESATGFSTHSIALCSLARAQKAKVYLGRAHRVYKVFEHALAVFCLAVVIQASALKERVKSMLVYHAK